MENISEQPKFEEIRIQKAVDHVLQSTIDALSLFSLPQSLATLIMKNALYEISNRQFSTICSNITIGNSREYSEDVDREKEPCNE